jgi:Cu+-exporting ATPase
MLTGESMPVDKQEGDEVFGSTILLNGSLQLTVNKEIAETALQKIVDMVSEAQTSKTQIEHLTDRIA